MLKRLQLQLQWWGDPMKGIGIDTVAIRKFTDVLKNSGDRFMEHVFTADERSYCAQAANPKQSLAGHFAAKEALIKAIPALRSYGVDWQEMEVTHDNFGAPKFVLSGKLLEGLKRIAASTIMLSISHTSETAVAMVVVA